MPIAAGARPPAFRLRGLDSEYWILGEPDARRSVVVILFGREAPASRILLPFVERLYRRPHTNESEIIGISVDSHQDTLEFAADFSFTFPILIDAPELRTVQSWRVERQPVLYRLDARLLVADCMEGWSREAFEGIARRHLDEAGARLRTVYEPRDIPPEMVAAKPVPGLRADSGSR